MTECKECRMPVMTCEYHPYAACLMFKACRNSLTVNANLEHVVSHGYQAGKDASDDKADAERYQWILDNSVQSGGGHGISCNFFVPVDHEDLGSAISEVIKNESNDKTNDLGFERIW